MEVTSVGRDGDTTTGGRGRGGGGGVREGLGRGGVMWM